MSNNGPILHTETDELLSSIRAQIKKESSGPGLIDAVQFYPLSVNGQAEKPTLTTPQEVSVGRAEGTPESLSFDKFGPELASPLSTSEAKLRAALSQIGMPPRPVNSLRGTVGRWVILGIRRMLWWYTRSLTTSAELLSRHLLKQQHSLLRVSEALHGTHSQLKHGLDKQRQLESQRLLLQSSVQELAGRYEAVRADVLQLNTRLAAETAAREALERRLVGEALRKQETETARLTQRANRMETGVPESNYEAGFVAKIPVQETVASQFRQNHGGDGLLQRGPQESRSTMDRRRVTIIILTWNGIDYTKRCLDTLRANTTFSHHKIVVVDNGSTDGTIEYLNAQRSITVISNQENLGFAKGNNQAIAVADPQSDIVLLNNDTEIHQPDWIERLQQTACSSPDIGVVGCRLARPQGAFQHAGTFMPVDTFWGQQVAGGEKDVNQYNADRDVEGVVFACVYIKREALAAIGLLDEDYFSYFEDTDYCLRAIDKGYRVVCCGSVTVVHHENVSTKVNQVKHSDMFLSAQKVFRDKWERPLRERYTREIGWHSLFNSPPGYALSSRELASALDRNGVHIAYKYVYGPGTPYPGDELEASEGYMVNVFRRRMLEPSRIQVVYGQGDVFERNFGRYKIGFTMLETDGIPPEWVRQANLMDEVWVPSSFNARTFRDSGVSRPIHVIPLGVDPNYFNPKILGQPLLDVYTFLSIFEWGERKMPELLLKAFNDEFWFGEDVVLLCKVLNGDPGVNVHDQVSALELDPNGGRIHLSLNQRIPTHQLGSLYRSADCFVLPTRGEGWGMPVMEAMACGLPVIATEWSAHCDFMNDQNAYPLPVNRLVPAEAKCPYYAGFNWAEPSYRDLRRLMRHVFENQAEARAMGEKASRYVLENYTWDHAALKIINRLDQIQGDLDHRPNPAVGRLRLGVSGGSL